MYTTIFQPGYRPQFSGHETFPLRYGWLKKAYDEVAASECSYSNNKFVFLGDDAIARFGVGKNMVRSIRHWGSSTGVLEEKRNENQIRTTELGKLLFATEGLDPYMEHPSTLWLIHWKLASCPFKTTWFWTFNYFPNLTFDRDHLVAGIKRLAIERKWRRVGTVTIKNDIACFIRTYVPQRLTSRAGKDDTLESVLTELKLIKAVGRRDGFRFVRGPKSTLGYGVFIFALLDFWSHFSKDTKTLSFESVAYAPGSPGRVFQIDEMGLAERLAGLEEQTEGILRWSETAGMKQVVRADDINFDESLSYVKSDYL